MAFSLHFHLARLRGFNHAALDGKLVRIESHRNEESGKYTVVFLDDRARPLVPVVPARRMPVKPENMRHACEFCLMAASEGSKLQQLCGLCMTARYCNAECQRKDFERHKSPACIHFCQVRKIVDLKNVRYATEEDVRSFASYSKNQDFLEIDALRTVRLMDESTVIRLSLVLADELQLPPSAFRMWLLQIADNAPAKNTHVYRPTVVVRKGWLSNAVDSHVKNTHNDVYVEVLPADRVGPGGRRVAEVDDAYRQLRANEAAWVEKLRAHLAELPEQQVAAAAAVRAGKPAVDPAEGCGIGSSNKPLDVLTVVDAAVGKALRAEIEDLTRSMAEWMMKNCVDTPDEAKLYFFKAYDPEDVLVDAAGHASTTKMHDGACATGTRGGEGKGEGDRAQGGEGASGAAPRVDALSPVVLDPARWARQRRYFTSPLKYLGYHVYEHPNDPLHRVVDLADHLEQRMEALMPPGTPLPPSWRYRESSMKYLFTQSTNATVDWFTSAFLLEENAKSTTAQAHTRLESRGWFKPGVVVVIEQRPPSASPFPWHVDNFTSWMKMMVGRQIMHVEPYSIVDAKFVARRVRHRLHRAQKTTTTAAVATATPPTKKQLQTAKTSPKALGEGPAFETLNADTRHLGEDDVAGNGTGTGSAVGGASTTDPAAASSSPSSSSAATATALAGTVFKLDVPYGSIETREFAEYLSEYLCVSPAQLSFIITQKGEDPRAEKPFTANDHSNVLLSKVVLDYRRGSSCLTDYVVHYSVDKFIHILDEDGGDDTMPTHPVCHWELSRPLPGVRVRLGEYVPSFSCLLKDAAGNIFKVLAGHLIFQVRCSSDPNIVFGYPDEIRNSIRLQMHKGVQMFHNNVTVQAKSTDGSVLGADVIEISGKSVEVVVEVFAVNADMSRGAMVGTPQSFDVKLLPGPPTRMNVRDIRGLPVTDPIEVAVGETLQGRGYKLWFYDAWGNRTGPVNGEARVQTNQGFDVAVSSSGDIALDDCNFDFVPPGLARIYPGVDGMLLGIMFTLYTTIKTRGKPDTTKQLASHEVKFYVKKQRRDGPVPSKDPVTKDTLTRVDEAHRDGDAATVVGPVGDADVALLKSMPSCSGCHWDLVKPVAGSRVQLGECLPMFGCALKDVAGDTMVDFVGDLIFQVRCATNNNVVFGCLDSANKHVRDWVLLTMDPKDKGVQRFDSWTVKAQSTDGSVLGANVIETSGKSVEVVVEVFAVNADMSRGAVVGTPQSFNVKLLPGPPTRMDVRDKDGLPVTDPINMVPGETLEGRGYELWLYDAWGNRTGTDVANGNLIVKTKSGFDVAVSSTGVAALHNYCAEAPAKCSMVEKFSLYWKAEKRINTVKKMRSQPQKQKLLASHNVTFSMSPYSSATLVLKLLQSEWAKQPQRYRLFPAIMTAVDNPADDTLAFSHHPTDCFPIGVVSVAGSVECVLRLSNWKMQMEVFAPGGVTRKLTTLAEGNGVFAFSTFIPHRTGIYMLRFSMEDIDGDKIILSQLNHLVQVYGNTVSALGHVEERDGAAPIQSPEPVPASADDDLFDDVIDMQQPASTDGVDTLHDKLFQLHVDEPPTQLVPPTPAAVHTVDEVDAPHESFPKIQISNSTPSESRPSTEPINKDALIRVDESQPTKRRFECLTCLERDHELASCSQCRAAEMRCRICRSCRICRVCAEKRFDCCSFCRSVFYCNAECLLRDWPVHQKECRRLESERAYRKARESANQGVPLRMLCRVCPGDGALCCKGCRSSFYCSQSCQRADWSAHKKECAGLAQKRREEDADIQELQLCVNALAISELEESIRRHGSDIDALERRFADQEVTAATLNEHALAISELKESTRSHGSDVDALKRNCLHLKTADLLNGAVYGNVDSPGYTSEDRHNWATASSDDASDADNKAWFDDSFSISVSVKSHHRPPADDLHRPPADHWSDLGSDTDSESDGAADDDASGTTADIPGTNSDSLADLERLEVTATPLTAADAAATGDSGAATDTNLPSAAAVPSPPVPTSPPAAAATRVPPRAAVDEPPADLCCPITMEVFVDPVACAGDGFTYERSEIEAHFQHRKENNLPLNSPKTNATLTTELLIPNNRVKLLCDNWRATHS